MIILTGIPAILSRFLLHSMRKACILFTVMNVSCFREGVIRMDVLRHTVSICPVCLKRIPADIIEDRGKLYMVKQCPSHGRFRDLYWGDAESYDRFMAYSNDAMPPTRDHQAAFSCPEKCGLCNRHKSSTVFANIDITDRCNQHCPVCFADSAGGTGEKDPPLDEIARRMDALRQSDPPCDVLQLSGGEPTIRNDLFDILKMAREKGFVQLQIATNGKKLAEDFTFARKMAESDVDTIYMQFDGTTPEPYHRLRGFNGLPQKIKAIENVRRAGPRPNVVLVPTLVKGVNDHQLGDMVRFALDHIDVVRGINFQPVAFTGRISEKRRLAARITIPDVIFSLCSQMADIIHPDDFLPIPAVRPVLDFFDRTNPGRYPRMNTHPLCGAWTFLIGKGSNAVPLSKLFRIPALIREIGEWDPGKKGHMAVTALCRLPRIIRWNRTKNMLLFLHLIKEAVFRRSMDAVSGLFNNDRILFLGMMHFQDPYNLDLARLERCCVHYSTGENRIVPFCAHNIFFRKSTI